MTTPRRGNAQVSGEAANCRRASPVRTVASYSVRADAVRFVAINPGFSLCHGRVWLSRGRHPIRRLLLPHFRMARGIALGMSETCTFGGTRAALCR